MDSPDPTSRLIPRNVRKLAVETLADTPVLIIQGARQVGKSTLTGQLLEGAPGRTFTLDDAAVLTAARNDPDGFVRQSVGGTMVIDEVQRAPQLLVAVKSAVDDDRRPGRFILTGSADLLRLPDTHESLAGRAETITVHSFSQGELLERTEDWVGALVRHGPQMLGEVSTDLDRASYAGIIATGGYPEAVRRAESRRSRWFENYVSRVIDHDAASVSRLTRLSEMGQLLRVIAANTSGELVKARVARQVGLPETVLPAYLELLEDLGLVHSIPAWGRNLTQRVVGRPKLIVADTGLCAHLVDQSAASLASIEGDGHLGPMLETLVAGELLRQQTWTASSFRLHHFRSRVGREVDLIGELADGRVIAVEVKAARSATAAHFRHLEFLRDELGDRFVAGVVLNSGPRGVQYGDRLWSAPVASLWAAG